MEIIIHQAIFGEQNKAWDLLNSTLPDITVAKKIAFKSDLQDSPPIGISWHPVIRGFLVNEFYLLIKTYPDFSPDVRNGRVFSHCFLISKSDLSFISDLSFLISIFKKDIDKTITLAPIKIFFKPKSNVSLNDTLELRFNKVVHVFSTMLNNYGSIIWIGQENYEFAVIKFWKMLSAAQKESFNFGINFNPSEIPNDKINFIVIPESLETKFENLGFNIIRKSDSMVLLDFFEQYLAGDEQIINRSKFFINAIELEEFTNKDIQIIAKGINTFENLSSINDLKLLITLSNIIAKYSPNISKGKILKKNLIDRICFVIKSADEDEVFLLKNIQISAFEGSEEQITKATEEWINDYLFSEKENKKKDFTILIFQIYNSGIPNWWIKIFIDKIVEFASQINQTKASIIWKWITSDVRLIQVLSSSIEESKKVEDYFINCFSTPIKSADLKELKLFAIEKKWFKLHASILKSEYEFKAALNEQIKVDIDTNFYEGIEILVRGIKPKEIISASVACGDKRCIIISGRLCKNNKTLLNGIEIENINWQEILLAAIKNGNQVSDGIKEPQKEFFKLYDLIVNEKSVCLELVEVISHSEYANVLDYANRTALWKKLPKKIRDSYLERTSSVLLEKLSNNSIIEVPDDNELSDYIISNAISTFLYFNSQNIKIVLPIFNTYNQLREYIIKDYISNYIGKIDMVDSTLLGKLIFSRKFQEAAYVIHSKVHSNKNFKYALAECYHLLDFWTKGSIKLSGILSDVEVTQDQWWEAFMELAIRLYNSGPTENKIWKQAGGEEYDLIQQVSGKKSWLNALSRLRNGGFKEITEKKLLKAMLKDYPKNDELLTLNDLWSKL